MQLTKKILFNRHRGIARRVIKLGLPVIVSNLSRSMMSLADMAMVGGLGAAALAATGMGSMLMWTLLSIGIALRTATQTVSSRRLGQKIYKECGTALHNGQILGAALGIPLALLCYRFANKIIPLFLDDPEVVKLCIEYSSILFLGTIFTIAGFVFQGFFTGIERTKIHMNVTVVANIVNVYLNAGLIYGREGILEILSSFKGVDLSWLGYLWSWFPFPEMGVRGAGLATLLASLWMAIHYCIYLFAPSIRKKYGVFSFRLNKAMMKRQLLLALPQGSQEMLVVLGFVVFYKIVGMIGTVELAATEVVFTILHTSFLPAAGIGQACATLVGKYLGERDTDKAEASIIESIRWSLIIMGSIGVIFVSLPHYILPVFSNDPEVIRIGVIALRVAGVIQIADAVGMTLWFALSGAGNTFFPALTEALVMWLVFLPFSYLTGIYLGWGYIGPWIGMGIHQALFAIILSWKTLKGDWKEIEV